MIARKLTEHRSQVQSFVEQAVDWVMQSLSESDGQTATDSSAATPIGDSLLDLLTPLSDRYSFSPQEIVKQFSSSVFPQVIEDCRVDAARYQTEDPALENFEEVFYASNGFWATVAYRIANSLHRLHVPIIPRAISSIAHSHTGVDIHPAASIAPGLFIDHGTGIAIGCTAVVHENVNLYNGVVLGTSSKPKRADTDTSQQIQKRHPTIESDVSLYTNAFVGGDITVGSGSTIGAYAFVCHEVEPNSIVYGKQGKKSSQSSSRSGGSSQSASTAKPTRANSSVIQLIGNTPVVRINNIAYNPNVTIYAKVEGMNPSGSIKDRIALSLIEQAEKKGELTPDKIILESTSGNTGIGLAMVGAAKGYQVVLTMSSAMSEERKQVLRGFGAKLIETPPDKGTGGAIEVARKMIADHPEKYWLARQHSSLSNPLAHYENTGVEILNQVPDVTHFVAGIGTFGTLRGAGQRLREEVGAKVVGLEPALGKPIQGLRNMQEPFSPELYDESLLDKKVTVYPEDAIKYARLLAQQEGIFAGMSSGAAIHGAVQLANSLDSGVIVVILPDRGEKYLSTPLFEDNAAQSSKHEPQAAKDESHSSENHAAQTHVLQHDHLSEEFVLDYVI